MCNYAGASTNTYGTSTWIVLSDGTIVAGFPQFAPNQFANEVMVSDNGNGRPNGGSYNITGQPFQFGQLPVVNIGGQNYFAITLDVQQAAVQDSINLTNMSFGFISGNNTSTVWTLPETLVINGTGYDSTASPTGNNGSDLNFFIPLSAFYGYGLTGSSYYYGMFSESGNTGGAEEFVAVKSSAWVAAGYSVTYLAANTTFETLGNELVVPEPKAFLLTAAGLSVILLRRFRSRTV